MGECMTQEDAKNMSNEQAIQILKPLRDMMCDQYGCPISDVVFALDKAIEALYGHKDPYEYYGKLEKAHDDGYEEGYGQAKFDYEPYWIPCSERLPNSQTEVIVSCRDDSADTICRYTASGWITTNGEYWIVDNEINPYVVAWMPLPKPYREESEE